MPFDAVNILPMGTFESQWTTKNRLKTLKWHVSKGGPMVLCHFKLQASAQLPVLTKTLVNLPEPDALGQTTRLWY